MTKADLINLNLLNIFSWLKLNLIFHFILKFCQLIEDFVYKEEGNGEGGAALPQYGLFC